jgi:hypothetical protein
MGRRQGIDDNRFQLTPFDSANVLGFIEQVWLKVRTNTSEDNLRRR